MQCNPRPGGPDESPPKEAGQDQGKDRKSLSHFNLDQEMPFRHTISLPMRLGTQSHWAIHECSLFSTVYDIRDYNESYERR